MGMSSLQCLFQEMLITKRRVCIYADPGPPWGSRVGLHIEIPGVPRVEDYLKKRGR